MIECIAEHSVETSLLNGGYCIDVGCLGFEFSKAMRDRGLKVYAFDLDEMRAPDGIIYIKAVVNKDWGWTSVNKTPDRQGWHITGNSSGELIEIISLNRIYDFCGGNVDVLKLDCEGAEYSIFGDSKFKPTPKQISIEFHEHCHSKLHQKHYDKCLDNLLKYYVPVQHELSERHGAGSNYWDSLFIRKDLV